MVFIGFTVSYWPEIKKKKKWGEGTRRKEHLSRLGQVVSRVVLSAHGWLVHSLACQGRLGWLSILWPYMFSSGCQASLGESLLWHHS